MYPNPSNGSFTFESNQIHENARLTITDIGGRIVYQSYIENKSEFQVNLNETSGIYIVEVSTASSTKTYKLVIK